jgi:hypothetical protein
MNQKNEPSDKKRRIDEYLVVVVVVVVVSGEAFYWKTRLSVFCRHTQAIKRFFPAKERYAFT